ncbi:MAG: cytochrome ubiquinol oxidase subunit I [Anaerolineales bacterium]|nr:cytochrome ubiquinol oxidase subunit I [Anaerolineales bacterium]MCX7754746.1 cytochrome ubiquinol oxidase subunit I [Anaerolineales bacterium]MDW8278508.1 cytochrome ubiquinol oxidase subunit I [Anaerolineales bacterium]
MDTTTLILSQWQFAMTSIYHWLFVPLTLGLGWFVAYFQTRYYQTRDEAWRKHAKFWGKLFLINFAIGVVTGIVQEFQFGMNWSEYSRFVGDIFGAPLAVEALLAFFMESTFLGVWIFGEGKVPEKVHLASIWLAALGSNLSAIWILIANGWMQHPVGYTIVDGRAQMTDFFAVIGNPKAWVMIWHTLADGLTMASFLLLAVSAWHLFNKKNVEFFKTSFQAGALVGLIASVILFLGGHTMGQYMFETQPMKFAALEAHWDTSAPADFSLLTIGDLSGRREVWSLRVPAVLSFLACNNFSCEVPGVYDLQAQYEAQYGPGQYIPLMVVTYWSFRIMMTFGFIMIAASAWYLWSSRKAGYEKAGWLKYVPLTSLVMMYGANMSGWILTEMGRQPWIVQGLLKVQDAVSPKLTALDLTISLIGYVALYGVLAVVMVKLMLKYAKAGPEAAMHESVDVAPALVGAQD